MSAAADSLDSETSQGAQILLETASTVLTNSAGKGKEYNEALTSSLNLMTQLAAANIDITASDSQQALLKKALSNTSKDLSSKAAAINVVGSMSNLGREGLNAAIEAGGIDAIMSTVSNHGENVATMQIAKSSLNQLTSNATNDISAIDTDTMVKLVEANAIVSEKNKNASEQRGNNDDDQLEKCIETLSGSSNGQAVLNKVLLTTKSDSAKVAVIDSLGKRIAVGDNVLIPTTNKEEVMKVLEGVRAHTEIKNTGIAGKESNAVVNVLNAIDLGNEGAGIFADEGGLDILDSLIASDNIENAQKAVSALSKIVAQNKLASEKRGTNDKRVNNRLKDLKVASQIASALANQADDDDNADFANECIALLQELTSEAEPEEIGLDEDAIRKIKKATANRKDSINMGSAFIKSLAHMSQVAAALASEGHVNEEILLAQWEVVFRRLADARHQS